MKRKIISCILLIIFCVALKVSLFSVNKNTTEHKLNIENNIAVMVYDEDEEDYVKQNSIPTGDYELNEELSYCEGKGHIEDYDNTLGIVTTRILGQDKCYFYFDLLTRQIALVPKPMSSNINSDGGVASAYIGNVQSGNIKTTAYVVFDDDITNNIDDGWGGDGNIANSQITYEFPSRVVVNKVMIANLNGGSNGRYYLYSVKVQRSNDGTNWTDVHTITDMGSNTANTEYYYEFENTTAAKYWRIKGVSSLNNYKWLIQELQFYGYYEIVNNPSDGVYSYSGGESTYVVPTTGTYKIEAWGAQGGNTYSAKDSTQQVHTGGYGAYSVGEISLTKGTTLYINVGGQGNINSELTGGTGGYNGGGTGGNGITQSSYSIKGAGGGGGGGASSVALSSGTLYQLGQNSKQSDVIIVAAGGGASGSGNQSGLGNAGGISSNSVSSNGTCGSVSLSGATQSSGYSFGLGGNGRNATCAQICNDCEGTGGGGGGYYGGNAYTGTGRSSTVSGTGGSSYIGYSTLSNKKMLCYTGCTTDTNTATKTETTSCTDSTATSDCLKTGNGAVKITLIDDNPLLSAPRSSLTLTTQCATEHGTCTFSGTKTVYYCGTSTCYYKKFIDSVSCENSIFGDPQSGATKYCYI